jgi:hypothetical protein
MAGDAVQESLQHALPPCDHRGIFLGLGLLRGIVTKSLLRGNRWNDEGRIQPHEARPEGLEFRVPMSGFRILYS